MRVVKKKSYKVNVVTPESNEEDEAIKKIIKDVEEENKKPFIADEWVTRRPESS